MTVGDAPDLRFFPSGDTGLTVVLGDVIDRATNQRVHALRRRIDAAGWDGVIETVPTYVSLLVHYDPLETSQEALRTQILSLADTSGEDVAQTGRRWTLPVCFDNDLAPDLGFVADHAGISPTEVIADLTGAEQVVYMLGFAPGLPYMGDLPDRIALPRRVSPVPKVPAGSVLIATGKTVIYPNENPTGWYTVGRTPVRLFDRGADVPVLLSPGDSVRFRPIERSEFSRIEADVAVHRFDPLRECLC